MEDYKKITQESYDKNALAFAQKFRGLMEFTRRYEFQLFLDLLKGEKILDIGAGGGDHAVYFKQKGLDVTCIDISPKFIELCKSKDLKAEVMDVEHMTFQPETFDGIWAVASLIHLKKSSLPNVMEKIHQILKPDGIFHIIVKEGEGEGFKSSLIDPTTKRYFAFYQEDEFLKILAPFFDIVDFRRITAKTNIFLQIFLRKK